MTRKTVGAIVSDFAQKSPDALDPQEIQRASEREYLRELRWCVGHALKEEACIKSCTKECKDRDKLEGDFFVEVILKKEKLLANTLRNYFIARKTCPKPFYDQTVYRYKAESGDISLEWVVPDYDSAETFKENRAIIVPEERELLKYVLAYYDGTLYRMMKEFNNEHMAQGCALKEK